jgi:DNA-binding CsgD family transcriptional regulator
VIRIFDELRDPWALALAQVTAVVTYLLGAPLWQAVLAGIAVLGVRIVAGIKFPLGRPTVLPPSVLTQHERMIVKLIAEGLSLELIASKKKLSPASLEKTYRSILEKLELRHDWEVRAWAITVGLVLRPPRPSPIERFLNSTSVRATLSAGGLLGLLWTLYQIWRTACPGLRATWPWLPDCP